MNISRNSFISPIQKQLKDRHTILLLLAVILFTSIYTIQVVWNHHCFRTYALDYGFYNQAIWDFAHFRSNTNTILEPPLPNYFQVHPGFTLIWILPLYWIFYPLFGSYALLIIQNIFIIAGGLATYALIRRKTNDRWIALLAFLHFNLIWGHYSALAADYIDTTVAASLVPLFILMFDKRKYFAATVVFLFVITCKENMPIWLFFISAALFFIYRERSSRIASSGFGFFSIIYFIFIFTVLIPYFEDPNRPYGFFQYSALGDNPADAVLYMIKHPGASLRMLFENHLNDPNLKGIKLEFHTVFMLSGGLLLIRRPVYFLMFIPVIAQKMYNDSFVRWGILGFYSIEAVSILTMAAFLATISIRKNALKYGLYIGLCVITLSVTIIKMGHRISFWYDPSKENLFSSSFYNCDWPAKEIKQKVRQYIPDEGTISASQNLLPHFANRKGVHMFPYADRAEYILILKGSSTYPLSPEAFALELQKFRIDPDWALIMEDDYLLILKRNIRGSEFSPPESLLLSPVPVLQ